MATRIEKVTALEPRGAEPSPATSWDVENVNFFKYNNAL